MAAVSDHGAGGGALTISERNTCTYGCCFIPFFFFFFVLLNTSVCLVCMYE